MTLFAFCSRVSSREMVMSNLLQGVLLDLIAGLTWAMGLMSGSPGYGFLRF